ncbi:MAG: type IV secretory system conjugative DNA transfer family protein [Clostridium sp.]|nr:type IV secretory system conjugative DNA transfer family protein [Clostridium sp.]
MIKKMLGYILGGMFSIILTGYLTSLLMTDLVPAFITGDWERLWKPELMLQSSTWIYGIAVTVMMVMLYMVFHVGTVKRAKRLLKAKEDSIESSLENSRFMTDKERDANFAPGKFTKLKEGKKDGVPVYAVYNKKKKELEINIASPMHSLIIGATGSGKTTSFINPMIQILGNSSAGSSMICTDPKGELFQLHSGMLSQRGYKVMVLDLRDPYSSFRWNPLGDLYDRYQLYLSAGQGIYQCDSDVRESGLELVNDVSQYKDVWYEYKGKAYAVRRELLTVVKVERQKIYDEVYEDLNDLISVICPIESQDDPVWEKGARSIIMAVCLAMLEDSQFPELEMTREKFCFYNVNKAISNSEEEFRVLKEYFMGRPKLSKALGLSRQVLSAADTTLASYMSIAFDKLSMFNDEGLCSLTSETDIDPLQFAMEPTALFLKIPDEKDTRHALAAVFVLCIYKALIKVASAREDLSLPRNVYFILDEFGNMPKIDKFDKMITVGRSRKIWFNMVVQSYAQLDNVYGQTISNIIKSNCGMKMFIGSNDIETCEEFSKLCGNKTVSTQSVSSTLGDRTGNINVSSQVQTRPLIYPSELQKLNNKTSTGNAIVVTFGNYPLKTQFTPSYKCPLYEMKTMDLSSLRMNAFFGDEIYYDLDERNYIVAGRQEKEREVSPE